MIKYRFRRFFMIFEQEDIGFSQDDRIPSGHLMIVLSRGKGKLIGYFSGLDSSSYYLYKLYLISASEKNAVLTKVCKVKPSKNRVRVEWEFDPWNVGGSLKRINDFNVAALMVYGQGLPLLSCPLAAYRGEKVNWRKGLMKAMSMNNYLKSPKKTSL